MSFRVTFISKNGDIMKNVSFWICLEKQMFGKTAFIGSICILITWKLAVKFLFIVNFSGFFHLLYLDRHSHLAGFCLFSHRPFDETWLTWMGSVLCLLFCKCSHDSLWQLVLVVSVYFVFSRILVCAVLGGAHIFWWQCWILLNLFSSNSANLHIRPKNFYSVATGSFYSRNCLKNFLALKVNSSVEIK